jgi:hypothetical protein
VISGCSIPFRRYVWCGWRLCLPVHVAARGTGSDLREHSSHVWKSALVSGDRRMEAGRSGGPAAGFRSARAGLRRPTRATPCLSGRTIGGHGRGRAGMAQPTEGVARSSRDPSRDRTGPGVRLSHRRGPRRVEAPGGKEVDGSPRQRLPQQRRLRRRDADPQSRGAVSRSGRVWTGTTDRWPEPAPTAGRTGVSSNWGPIRPDPIDPL